MNFPLCLDQRLYLSQTAHSVMVHHNLCLDENSMGISTGYKQGVSRGWQLVSSDTAVSSHPWTVSVSKGWHYTRYICHQSPLASRNWASFFILKTIKEPGSSCQSCSWWQSTSHMLHGLWVPPPHLTLHVFVIERTKEPASKTLINQVKMTQIVVTVPGSERSMFSCLLFVSVLRNKAQTQFRSGLELEFLATQFDLVILVDWEY